MQLQSYTEVNVSFSYRCLLLWIDMQTTTSIYSSGSIKLKDHNIEWNHAYSSRGNHLRHFEAPSGTEEVADSQTLQAKDQPI